MFPFIIVKNAIYTLIFMNLDNNHKNATEKELYKIKHLLRVKLIPELDELDNKLKTNTVEDIIEDHPEMDKIIRKRKEIIENNRLFLFFANKKRQVFCNIGSTIIRQVIT